MFFLSIACQVINLMSFVFFICEYVSCGLAATIGAMDLGSVAC